MFFTLHLRPRFTECTGSVIAYRSQLLDEMRKVKLVGLSGCKEGEENVKKRSTQVL